MRFFSSAICWIASPAEDDAPSASTVTPWSSIHWRASVPAMSGLFWSSPWMTSTARSSSRPPKSCTAISAASLLPGPPTSLYGPPTSLNRPILIGVELVCARMIAGFASGAAASAPIRARRVILLISLPSVPASGFSPSPVFVRVSAGRRPASQAVDPRGHVMEQQRLLGRRRAGGDALERVPQHGVAAHGLVDREVAFEHAPRRAEVLDARVHVRPPCGGEFLRRRRHRALVEAEARHQHRQPAELHGHVRARREPLHVAPPVGE